MVIALYISPDVDAESAYQAIKAIMGHLEEITEMAPMTRQALAGGIDFQEDGVNKHVAWGIPVEWVQSVHQVGLKRK